MKIIILLAVVVLLRSSSSDSSPTTVKTPIQLCEMTPGLRYQGVEPRPKIQLEIFIEVNCPDCLYAWPIVKKVQAHYGNDSLDIVVQQLPLPYHRNGFLCTQGIYVIRDEKRDYVFAYIEAVLENWRLFSTSSTVNQTETEVLDNLADIAVASTGIDKSLFIAEITKKRAETVAIWKYAVKRGAAGTPTYFVNGMEVACEPNFFPTYDEWIEFFDPMIN